MLIISSVSARYGKHKFLKALMPVMLLKTRHIDKAETLEGAILFFLSFEVKHLQVTIHRKKQVSLINKREGVHRSVNVAL